MKYIHRQELTNGDTNILLGINLSKEELEAILRFAPEEEVNPANYDFHHLDQLLCWLRILVHYTELWKNRNEDYAKKAITRMATFKGKREKKKISGKRKRAKSSRRKKSKKYSE